jgi:hypothetical protein
MPLVERRHGNAPRIAGKWVVRTLSEGWLKPNTRPQSHASAHRRASGTFFECERR